MSPVDALWDVVDAVGRAVGDGLTLAAEVLCPRDHLAEERLRSWEAAAVAVEDEICDEAEAEADEDYLFTTTWAEYNAKKSSAAVSAAADGAADRKAASPTPVGVEGPEGASAIPPAAPSGQPTDPGAVSTPAPGEQVRGDDLSAHLETVQIRGNRLGLEWCERITNSLLADFNITRK